jgi:hypothetical protein
MKFKCTTCKVEPERLHMFGKFVDNKDGMDDDGEYCDKCFDLKCVKYKIEESNQVIQNDSQNQ